MLSLAYFVFKTKKKSEGGGSLTSLAGPLRVEPQGSVRVVDEHARALLGRVERVLAVALGVEKSLRAGRGEAGWRIESVNAESE